MKTQFVLLSIVFLLYIWINSLLLFTSPPIWPDESGYADGALNLLRENRLFSSLWGDIGHYQKGVYWYPPFIFYWFSFMFKIFGFSIETMRYTTFFIGGVFLFVFFLFTKGFFKKYSYLAALPLFFILLDQAVLDKTRIARPEIFVLLFTLASSLVVLQAKKYWQYAVAGIFAGLALVTHFAGAIAILLVGTYLLISKPITKETFMRLLLFSIPIMFWLVWWMSVINFDIETLLDGLVQQRARKSAPLFIMQLFNPGYFVSALRDVLIFFGSIFLVIYLYLQKEVKLRIFLILSLVVTWAYILFTKGDMVYPVPFFYLALTIFLYRSYKKTSENPMYFIVAIMITLFSVGLSIKELIIKFSNRPSHHKFAQAVSEKIPDNSDVFISTLPNVYFELRKNETLDLMLFLEANGYKKEYINELDKMDYVVINHDLSMDIYGDLVTRYITVNAESITPVQLEKNGYGAYVIKLKPKIERQKIE